MAEVGHAVGDPQVGADCFFVRALAASATLSTLLDKLVSFAVTGNWDKTELVELLAEIYGALDSPDLKNHLFPVTHAHAVFTIICLSELGPALVSALCVAQRMGLVAGLSVGQLLVVSRRVSDCLREWPSLSVQLSDHAGCRDMGCTTDFTMQLLKLREDARSTLSSLDWGTKDGVALFCFFSRELGEFPGARRLLSSFFTNKDTQFPVSERISSLASMIRESEGVCRGIERAARFLSEGNLSDVVERSLQRASKLPLISLQVAVCYAALVSPVKDVSPQANEYVSSILSHVFDSFFMSFPIYGPRAGGANTWLAAAKHAELVSRGSLRGKAADAAAAQSSPPPSSSSEEAALQVKELAKLLAHVHNCGQLDEALSAAVESLMRCSIECSGHVSPERQTQAVLFWIQLLLQALIFLNHLKAVGSKTLSKKKLQKVDRQTLSIFQMMKTDLSLFSGPLTQSMTIPYHATADVIIIFCGERIADASTHSELKSLCQDVICEFFNHLDTEALHYTSMWLLEHFGGFYQLIVYSIKNLLKQRAGTWLFKFLDALRVWADLKEGLDRWSVWSDRLSQFLEDISAGRDSGAIAFLGLPITEGVINLVDSVAHSLQPGKDTRFVSNLAVSADILSLYVYNTNYSTLPSTQVTTVLSLLDKLFSISTLLKGRISRQFDEHISRIANNMVQRLFSTLSALFPGIWIRKCVESPELGQTHGLPTELIILYEKLMKAGHCTPNTSSSHTLSGRPASSNPGTDQLEHCLATADISLLYDTSFGALSVPAVDHIIRKHKLSLLPLRERLDLCMTGNYDFSQNVSAAGVLYTSTFALKLMALNGESWQASDRTTLALSTLQFGERIITTLRQHSESLNTPAGCLLCHEIFNLTAGLLIAVYVSDIPGVEASAISLLAALRLWLSSKNQHDMVAKVSDRKSWDMFGRPGQPQVPGSVFLAWMSTCFCPGRASKHSRRLCRYLKGLAKQCAMCNSEEKFATALAAFWDRPEESGIGCASLISPMLTSASDRYTAIRGMVTLLFAAKAGSMVSAISGRRADAPAHPNDPFSHVPDCLSKLPADAAISSTRILSSTLNYLLANIGSHSIRAGSAELQLIRLLCALLYPIEGNIQTLERVFLMLHRESWLRSCLQEEVYGSLETAINLLDGDIDPTDVALALREYRPRRDDDYLELLLKFARRAQANRKWQGAAVLQTLCSGPRFEKGITRLGVLARSAAEVRQLLGLAVR